MNELEFDVENVAFGEKLAIVAGNRELPAARVEWHLPLGPLDSGFCVLYSDLDDLVGPRDGEAIRMDDLLDLGDVELGRGLDLAREHMGAVDWNADKGGWFAVEGTPVEEELASL